MKTQWLIQAILTKSTIWQCPLIVLWPGKRYSQVQICFSPSSTTSWEPSWSLPPNPSEPRGQGNGAALRLSYGFAQRQREGVARELLKYNAWKYAQIGICMYVYMYMNVCVCIYLFFNLCMEILVFSPFIWHTVNFWIPSLADFRISTFSFLLSNP